MKSKPNTPRTRLEPEDIIIGGPVLRLLAKTKAPPILIGVAYSVVFYTVRGFVAWCAGHLRTSGGTTGFFDDPGMYTNVFAGAIFWAYYIWMPRGIAGVFSGLYDNRVIDDPVDVEVTREQVYQSFVEQLRGWFRKWWWTAGLLVIAISVVAFLVAPQYVELGQSAYWTADTISLILSLLWAFTSLYCVSLLLTYSVFETYWLTRAFNGFRICIRPLHPDRAGGLAPIGGFNLMLSYLIALVGIMFVLTPLTRNYVVTGTWQFRWTTELMIGLGVYALASPIAFFAPLSAAHKAMKEAKHELLLRIAGRFEAEYANIQNALCLSDDSSSDLERQAKMLGDLRAVHDRDIASSPSRDISGLKQSLETLKEIQALHDMTSKFPVWPFNISNLARFGTSYLTPVLLAIVVDLVGRLIGP